MRSTKFNIVNLGCKVNRVEADTMHASLLSQGAVPSDEEAADLIIVNTCTVTGEADKKTRKAVHHALAVNPVADVVVTGCAAAISPEVFQALDPRIRVVGKHELLQSLTPTQSVAPLRTGEGFRTRVGIKVQDGCNHACTYCIVHVARGKTSSISAAAVIQEARAYFQAGVKELVLTGIDIGAYNDSGIKLTSLVESLLAESEAVCASGEQAARIRISSIEPNSIDEGLISLLASSNGQLCRHLHIPLQSGSSKVLSEMNRPYSAEQYLELIQALRQAVPTISLSTDIIVGFPGETEDDFNATCEVARKAGFSRIHVFPYSIRRGTPAAERADQIPATVKKTRAAELRRIARELACADLENRKGTTELCIIEDTIALTESYHEIAVPADAVLGALIPLRL